MVVLSATGRGRPTLYAKKMAAQFMFSRGQSFLAAAVLLEQKAGDDYAVLYLICQSLEIILKSLLLFSDYNFFVMRIAKKPYGHDLVNLAKKAQELYQSKPLSLDVSNELGMLNTLYKDAPMPLRYASVFDFLRNSKDIKRDLVFRKMVALIRLMRRELAR